MGIFWEAHTLSTSQVSYLYVDKTTYSYVMMTVTNVKLLETYQGPAKLRFENGEILEIPEGKYYTSAFGLAFNKATYVFMYTPNSAWKIGR